MYKKSLAQREEVIPKYGRSFRDINHLLHDDLRSFLPYKNNKHWTGLERQSKRIFSNFESVRRALKTLLDESKPLSSRYNEAEAIASVLVRAKLTAILHVSDPAKYGVWNGTTEAALKYVELWPAKKAADGESDAAINERLLELNKSIGADDLWVLDAFWWYITGN